MDLIKTYMKQFSKRKRKYNVYLCDCGQTFEYSAYHAERRSIEKCNSCVSKKFLCRDNPSEYKSWQHMKSRCLNKNNKRYSDWGGRGIKVCDRWTNSFENFLNDMGKKPSNGKYEYSIDRTDNDGDYEPSNCKWSTAKEQNNNKRTNTHVQ